MRKLPYQSSLQFIQRPQLLWNDIGDRKLWRGIQWIRRGPIVPSRLSWNAYQSNIPKPRSGVRWKHGMRRFSEYGNVASRLFNKSICKSDGKSWKTTSQLENNDINHPKNISNQHNPIIKRWAKSDPLPIRGSFASDVHKSPASPHHCRWSRWVPSWWPPLRVSWPMTPVVFPRHAQIIFQAHVSRKFHPFFSDVHLTISAFQQHFNHKNSSRSKNYW